MPMNHPAGSKGSTGQNRLLASWRLGGSKVYLRRRINDCNIVRLKVEKSCHMTAIASILKGRINRMCGVYYSGGLP